MHLFYTPETLQLAIPAGNCQVAYLLNEEESKHCIRVLRLSIGATILLIDGNGGWYESIIIEDNPRRCKVKITHAKQGFGKRNFNLHIAIAPTKNMDRLEWFIEKATEIGIHEVSIINCNNSERTVVKNDRLQKVAIAAIKQSLKAFLPKINELTDFKKFIAENENFAGQKFIAHCHASISGIKELSETKHLKNLYKQGANILLLIGPEGDFSVDEVKIAIKSGYEEVKLGTSRLRTETAALYACTSINIINE